LIKILCTFISTFIDVQQKASVIDDRQVQARILQYQVHSKIDSLPYSYFGHPTSCVKKVSDGSEFGTAHHHTGSGKPSISALQVLKDIASNASKTSFEEMQVNKHSFFNFFIITFFVCVLFCLFGN